MNVRRLYASTPAQIEPARSRSDANRPSVGPPHHLRKVTDEVILSARARKALEELRSHPDVATSIRSGMQAERLTDERREEVNGRIAQGYYRQPHVLRSVAFGMASVLA